MTAHSTHLVLVPGLACTDDLFAEQIASLRGEAAISIADHTGHDMMSAIARAVLAMAPNRFALCGLSMDGYIAFEMVRQAPDRIERLALLDTSALSDTPEQTERRLKLIASGFGRRGHDFGRPTPALPARRDAFNSSGSHGMRRRRESAFRYRTLRPALRLPRPLPPAIRAQARGKGYP
jgi:pimeloyl-ACP methyl ester carboxylesterase